MEVSSTCWSSSLIKSWETVSIWLWFAFSSVLSIVVGIGDIGIGDVSIGGVVDTGDILGLLGLSIHDLGLLFAVPGG